jgi:hypothetical protein
VKLKIDLRGVPIDQLPTEERSGRRFYKIHFVLETTLHSTNLLFTLVRGKEKCDSKLVQFL